MADPLHKHRGSAIIAFLIQRPIHRVSAVLVMSLALAVSSIPPLPVSGYGARREGVALAAMQPGSPIPISDTTRVMPDMPAEADTLSQDSLFSLADTVRLPPREFLPPNTGGDSASQRLEQIWNSPVWPSPPPPEFAAGDLSDWLTYQPAFDVDDAPGPGQFRRYTHWGLIDRVGDWNVEGRSFGWQRLSFPQAAQFDAKLLPSFEYRTIEAGERVNLRRSDDWPLESLSSYFLRQGDYGETYSQGNFRRRFPSAFAIDVDFLFYLNKGRLTGKNAKTRDLRLQLVGPLHRKTFWSFEFTQFQDKSRILTPDEYNVASAEHDDLLYALDARIYRPSDSVFFRAAGLRLQSGKHDISTNTAHQLESHDQTWTLWGEGVSHGWRLGAFGMVEHLRLSPTDKTRGGVSFDGKRLWPVGHWGSSSLHATISGWDTNPFALSVAGVIAADQGDHPLIPSAKLERVRIIPTLFDRLRPRIDAEIAGAGGTGLSLYSEEGDPSLSAEWRNSATVSLRTRSDSTHTRFEFVTQARATYVQGYIRWEDVSTTGTMALYRPVSGDARTIGIAAAMRSHLFSRFHIWLNYAAKYAETIHHERLAGYYPHKGSAILSWIAPQFRYKIDLRLNAAVIWWYGDTRIDPTGYSNSSTFRVDLSGSATMTSFTFYYSMQNIANFPYRTAAGYPYTGRTIRFGFNWNFLN